MFSVVEPRSDQFLDARQCKEDNAMSQETAGSDSNFQGRCKSVMNVIRRVLSFREKRPTSQQDSEESTPLSIEMQPIASTPTTATSSNKPRVDSLPSSEMPSTSAASAPSVPRRAPSVYEDPFVAVAADGTIYVKHYYNFNERAEHTMETVRHGHIRRNCRVLNVKNVSRVHYAPGPSCTDRAVCKSWGICSNNVWWASHHNRMDGVNPYTNVVLIDECVLYPGFTVINIDAFAETLQCVGLALDAPFQMGIPSPPLNMLRIPFIDEDEEEAPKKRKQRRQSSKTKPDQ
uniref:Tudor domain-containing protein n=1 Tax=Caenorhabditis tropicalis TaxID=1561998 RepID=A0A1I7TCR3_9PELO